MASFRWQYDERDIRPDVELNLPPDWKLQVFKVTSGDSGKHYWIQVLRQKDWKASRRQTITLCNCPEGQFLAPLVVVGLGEHRCKHATALLAYLEDKEEKGH